MNQHTELARIVANMIRLGTIAEVDLEAARCRVSTGGITTSWLPWQTGRAAAASYWHAPAVGEQAVILSPSGDPAQGIVLIGIYSNSQPAPASTASQHLIRWANGDFMRHDSATGELVIQCSGPIRINGQTIHLNE